MYRVEENERPCERFRHWRKKAIIYSNWQIVVDIGGAVVKRKILAFVFIFMLSLVMINLSNEVEGEYIGTEIQITTDESYPMRPAIYGDRIVWGDERNGEATWRKISERTCLYEVRKSSYNENVSQDWLYTLFLRS